LQAFSRRVRSFGARVFYEIITEISRSLQAGEVVFGIVERYAERLDADLLRVTGGDRFPPGPMRSVR
jgi:hypothetical protein